MIDQVLHSIVYPTLSSIDPSITDTVTRLATSFFSLFQTTAPPPIPDTSLFSFLPSAISRITTLFGFNGFI